MCGEILLGTQMGREALMGTQMYGATDKNTDVRPHAHLMFSPGARGKTF